MQGRISKILLIICAKNGYLSIWYNLFRFRVGIAPLEVEIKEKKTELGKFDALVSAKKSELETYQREMEQVSQELGKINDNDNLSNKIASTIETSPILLGVLAVSLILNLLAITQLGRLPFFVKRR